MRWDTVIPVWLDRIAADDSVKSVLGVWPEVFMVGERERAVPSLEWSMISDIEGELWETTIVQLDFWANSIEQIVTLAGALRRLLHHDLPITVGGITMWSQLVGGRQLTGPSDGTLNHSLDFRLQYLRGKRT